MSIAVFGTLIYTCAAYGLLAHAGGDDLYRCTPGVPTTTPYKGVPILPFYPLFSVKMEANIITESSTVYAEEFWNDGNAALHLYQNGASQKYILNYDTNEEYQLISTNVCFLNKITTPYNRTLFGIHGTPNGTHVFSTNNLMNIARLNGQIYLGKKVIRGINCEHMRTCVPGNTETATFTLDFYISSEEWVTAAGMKKVPVRAEIFGTRMKRFGTDDKFHHLYDYFDFKALNFDSSVFQPPSEVKCIENKQVPSFPKSFSAVEEVWNKFSMDGKVVYKIWYSHELHLVRTETKSERWGHKTIISDFNTGLKYTTNHLTGRCVINSLSDGDFGVDNSNSHKLAMKSSEKVFDINDSFLHTGEDVVRGQSCDKFLGESTTFIPGFNATLEYCFSSGSPLQLKVRLYQWEKTEDVDFIYSFYDFNSSTPTIADFDIRSCYPPERTLNTRVIFTGPVGRVWNSHRKDLLLKSTYAVASAGGLHPILLSDSRIDIKSYNQAIFSTTILDNTSHRQGLPSEFRIHSVLNMINGGLLKFDIQQNTTILPFRASNATWDYLGSIQKNLTYVSNFMNICDGQKEHIKCPHGSYIRITSAMYGGNNPSICPGSNVSVYECRSQNADIILESKCNWSETCEVVTDVSEFGNPCPGYDKYLQMSYQCVTD